METFHFEHKDTEKLPQKPHNNHIKQHTLKRSYAMIFDVSGDCKQGESRPPITPPKRIKENDQLKFYVPGKSRKLQLSVPGKARATVKEFKEELPALHVSRSLQSTQMPNPNDIPEILSEDEVPRSPSKVEEAYEHASLSVLSPSVRTIQVAATNSLALHINGGLHHEVWDPTRYDVHELTGYIQFKPEKALISGGCKPSSCPRLVWLSLEVYAKARRSRFGQPRTDDRRIAEVCAPSSAFYTKSPKTQEKPTRAPALLTRGRTIHIGTPRRRSFSILSDVSPPKPLPNPSIQMGAFSDLNEEARRTDFTITIPTGGILFESTCTSSVTRVFSIKARGIARAVVDGAIILYECDVADFRFSVSALNKEHMMYGWEERIDCSS